MLNRFMAFITEWDKITFPKSLSCTWFFFIFHFLNSHAEAFFFFFVLLHCVTSWSIWASRKQPQKARMTFAVQGLYILMVQNGLCLPGGRNTCAAECTAAWCCPKHRVTYWNQSHGKSGFSKSWCCWVCISSSTSTLQRRDGAWNKHEGTAEFTVFCISIFSVFHWGNWSTECLLSPTSSVWCLCVTTHAWPCWIVFPRFFLHSIFVRCFYIAWNVCEIFLPWNVENS